MLAALLLVSWDISLPLHWIATTSLALLELQLVNIRSWDFLRFHNHVSLFLITNTIGSVPLKNPDKYNLILITFSLHNELKAINTVLDYVKCYEEIKVAIGSTVLDYMKCYEGIREALGSRD